MLRRKTYLLYILFIFSLLCSDVQNMYLETEMNKMEVCPHFAERKEKKKKERGSRKELGENRRTRDENKTSNNAR